jgi:hypothetical protein
MYNHLVNGAERGEKGVEAVAVVALAEGVMHRPTEQQSILLCSRETSKKLFFSRQSHYIGRRNTLRICKKYKYVCIYIYIKIYIYKDIYIYIYIYKDVDI